MRCVWYFFQSRPHDRLTFNHDSIWGYGMKLDKSGQLNPKSYNSFLGVSKCQKGRPLEIGICNGISESIHIIHGFQLQQFSDFWPRFPLSWKFKVENPRAGFANFSFWICPFLEFREFLDQCVCQFFRNPEM